MFDPWQLRTLRELARRGTMAAVAEAFSLSPSAVSQQLASLEHEAGAKLFEHDGRRVRLTLAGQALASRAHAILVALQEAADEASALDRDAAGTLRLASFPTAAAALCAPVMTQLAERFPRHEVTLAEMAPPAAIAALVDGDVDVGLVDEPALAIGRSEDGISHAEIYVDPLYCVMSRDHPAARRRRVDLRAMASEAWIMDDPTCTFYRLTVDLCQAAGFQPKIVANTESALVYAALVGAGAGISILPGLALAGMRALAFRPIAPTVVRRIHAVYRTGSETRPSIATALALLRETADQVGKAIAARGGQRMARLVPGGDGSRA
jgi:DNA-binding transcriptional LysR family regulator